MEVLMNSLSWISGLYHKCLICKCVCVCLCLYINIKQRLSELKYIIAINSKKPYNKYFEWKCHYKWSHMENN